MNNSETVDFRPLRRTWFVSRWSQIVIAVSFIALSILVLEGCSRKQEDEQDNKPSNSSKDKDEQSKNQDENGQDETGNPKRQDTNSKLPAFESFELLMSMSAGFLSVDAIAFAPDGKTFVTCSDMPRMWKMGQEEALHEFEGIYPLTGTIVEPEAIAISSDSKVLAFAGGDGTIYMADFEQRTVIREIEAHSAGVVSLSFSSDGKILASSGYDGKAKTWSSETGELIATCDVQPDRRVRSSIVPNGSLLATAGQEAQVWDTKSGEMKMKLDIGEDRQISVWFVDVSSNGAKIATGDATKDFENAAMIWSVESGKLEATLKHEYGVRIGQFSPNGELLATSDMNGVVRIWRLADNQLVQKIESEEVTYVDALKWTPDGKMLAISNDGKIQFWGQPGSINSADGAGAGIKSEKGDPNNGEGTQDKVNEDKQEETPDSTDAAPNKENANEQSVQKPVAFDSVEPISVSAAGEIFIAKDFPAPFGTSPESYSSAIEAAFMVRPAV